jgi:hypothetical protein
MVVDATLDVELLSAGRNAVVVEVRRVVTGGSATVVSTASGTGVDCRVANPTAPATPSVRTRTLDVKMTLRRRSEGGFL